MSNVTYRSNDQQAGAVPVDTIIKTFTTTDNEQIQGIILTDTVGNSAMDSATGTVMTTTYEHHEIHAGDHYFIRGVQDLSINNVLDFTILTPNTTKWLHFTWELGTENETNWLIYENATATTDLANVVTPINSNRNSGNTSGAVFRYELQASLAAANADTDVTGATLLESGISGALRTVGQDKRDNELILKQNTLYCLRGIATVAGYVDFTMEWYEHTNKV